MSVNRQRVFGEIPQGVERIAPGYFSAPMEREHALRYAWASRWVRGKAVLDVACGTGYGSAILLRNRARSVVAVDRSAPALTFAVQTYPGPRYVLADAVALPLRDGAFDVVVSLETIEHLAHPIPFLRRMRAVLREGGLLALSTPNRVRSAGSNPYHLHEMTLADLLECLERTAFEVVGRWGQFWRLPERKGLWRLKGLGRLAYEIGRSPRVWRAPGLVGFEPHCWCILSRAGGSA